MLKIIFFGTPGFAVPSLNALVEHGHEIKLVVTQPDKPEGRGLKVGRGKVAARGDEYKLRIRQPQKLLEIKNELLALDVDCAVVAAYGKILPDWLLGIGRFGCINVHPSLLPRYRGPSPIETALMNGDKETGVSIMKLTSGMDEGPVYIQKRVKIKPEDDFKSLSDKLSRLSAEALIEVLQLIEKGGAKPTEQPRELATYCKKIEKSDLKIDWHNSARTIVSKIRAFSPKPAAFTVIDGKRIKVIKAVCCDIAPKVIGQVGIAKDRLVVGALDGGVRIEQLQPEGKRIMTASEFVRGLRKAEKLKAS